MASHQPLSDGAVYLYQCIVNSSCTIDWATVGAALDLKTGTASKRYSRLRQRIDKSNAGFSAKWSGELDPDGDFLLRCIKSCQCQIDFNAVGNALGLKPATASKRYSRLLAKYNDGRETLENDTATIGTPLPTSGSKKNTPKKRGIVAESHSDTDEPFTPVKKQKMNTGEDATAQVPHAKIKQEDRHDASIPSTDGPGDLMRGSNFVVKKESATPMPFEKRQTRGKKIDFSDMLAVDSDSDQIDASDSDNFVEEQSSGESDEFMEDSETEGSTFAKPLKTTSFRVARRSNPNHRSAGKTSPITPIGLSGVQTWHTSANTRQAVNRSSMPPPPVKIASPVPATDALEAEEERRVGVALKRRGTSDLDSDLAVQLQHELEMGSKSGPVLGENFSDEVISSIEAVEQDSPSFLTRLTSWWR